MLQDMLKYIMMVQLYPTSQGGIEACGLENLIYLGLVQRSGNMIGTCSRLASEVLLLTV